MKLCIRVLIAAAGLAVFSSLGCNKNSANEQPSTNSVAMPATNGMMGGYGAAGMTNENTNMPAHNK